MKLADSSSVPAKACQVIHRVVAEDSDVVLAYLFGSAATGRGGPLSDIDVAVWLRDEGSAAGSLGRLMDKLCLALKTDRVDLISLREAPVSLSYRVIKYGRLLKCTDAKLRERFEANVVLRYLDMKPFRERVFDGVRRQVLGAV